MGEFVFTIDELTLLSLHYELMSRDLQTVAGELEGPAAREAMSRVAEKVAALSAFYRRVGERIQLEERKKEMTNGPKILSTVLVLVIVALLTGVMGVAAQETPPPPSPQAGRVIATVDAAAADAENRVPTAGQGLDGNIETLFVAFFVVFILGAGVFLALQQRNINVLLEANHRILENKRVMDEAERRYLESSLPVQQVVNLFAGFAAVIAKANIGGGGSLVDTEADKLADFLSKVTDGQPNDPPASAIQAQG